MAMVIVPGGGGGGGDEFEADDVGGEDVWGDGGFGADGDASVGAGGGGAGEVVVLRPVEALGEEIAGLAAGIAAATCRMLVLLAEFDAREGWQGWGIASCAHWLAWRCGLSTGTAREHVRIARALTHLPGTREAFAAGHLSYSKVRAITRVATAQTEPELLAVAAAATANQLDRFVAAVRRVESLDAVNARHAQRFLRYRQEDDGCYTLTVRLAPEDAAVVIERLETGRDYLAQTDSGASTDPEPASFERETVTHGRGLVDALVLVCAQSTVGDPTSTGTGTGTGVGLGSRRSESVLHVTLDDLSRAGTTGTGAVDNDVPVGHVGAGTPDLAAGPDAPAGPPVAATDAGAAFLVDVPAGTSAGAALAPHADILAPTPVRITDAPAGTSDRLAYTGSVEVRDAPAGTSITGPDSEAEIPIDAPAGTSATAAGRDGAAQIGVPATTPSGGLFGQHLPTSHLVGPHLELGPSLHPETARRLTCDTGLVLHLHADTGPAFTLAPNARPGRTIDLGRRTRTPNAALLRALWDRDQGCRYQGCERRRYVHAHHIQHWADGGPTRLDNLVLLCGQHHRLLHEGAYHITLRPDGTTLVTDPHGRPVPHAPDATNRPGLGELADGEDDGDGSGDWPPAANATRGGSTRSASYGHAPSPTTAMIPATTATRPTRSPRSTADPCTSATPSATPSRSGTNTTNTPTTSEPPDCILPRGAACSSRQGQRPRVPACRGRYSGSPRVVTTRSKCVANPPVLSLEAAFAAQRRAPAPRVIFRDPSGSRMRRGEVPPVRRVRMYSLGPQRIGHPRVEHHTFPRERRK